ncbi:hypothetical protein LC087_03880 [Bacillus carboniphilus]|uniref:Sporulation protein YjcZ n=1 Tax=Bacillus carboniphilus TaxID=86663 RepID=A0ABY9JY14_9BACI|nr:hypothetical protein [Bacillus carboniphilus]WLR43335.1 hypothetical protein LC087_03880 [Bacillus carboniphilus]
MSRYYHDVCNRYRGRHVRITEKCGRVHTGRIVNVTPNQVFIQPSGRARGYGYGYYGYPYFPAYGIGLGLIAGVALAGLFFW